MLFTLVSNVMMKLAAKLLATGYPYDLLLLNQTVNCQKWASGRLAMTLRTA